MVHVVRNVPMRRMLPKPASREELGLPPDKHLLVLQGSGINVQRGAEELVEAMDYLDDCHLIIIGGGDVLPVLKMNVEKKHLEDKVSFFPRMSYQNMMAITQLADLGFTLDKDTNLNYRFSLPNKIFDYIQAGVPIIASRLPEIERVISGYDVGCFIEKHDSQIIADTIKRALSDEKILRTWKNNLTFAALNLCWEKEENVLLAVYSKYI